MENIQDGQMLGPYRIINQIGQGGMATIFKAYQAAMDRYVAIKVLPFQFAQSPEFITRFQQEARTIAKLEHPHILPVHDFGEANGVPYLVMRYLDAGTLKDRIKAGPLSLTEIDRYFSQLADALSYAHANGVIHRDIKPSNALIDQNGNIFLTDFGIAKILESSVNLTASGTVTGTPAYMSPEQAQGEKLDQRTDIYSLGIVLYEMLTGRVPFEAETPLAVLLKHLNEPLPPPTTLKPDLAPALERVVLKALAKDRNDRYATCTEFLNAWKHELAEAQKPQLTQRAFVLPPAATTQLDRSPAPQRRSIPPIAIIGGVALVVVIAIGLLVINLIRLSVPADAITPTPNALATQIAGSVAATVNAVNAEATSESIVPPTDLPTVQPTEVQDNVPPASASFSAITFAIGEHNEDPIDSMDSFPGGVTLVYAIFSGIDIKDGQAWSDQWYYNGELQSNLSKSSTWDAKTAGPNSIWWLTIYNDQGIRSGDWELKLYIDGKLVQHGQMTVEDNVQPDFGPITFAQNVDANDQPVDPVDVSDPAFSSGITTTYAFFNGINVPSGTTWSTEWDLNGSKLDGKDHTWQFGPNEQDWISFGGDTPLDPGVYELKLFIDGQVVNIGSFVVASN